MVENKPQLKPCPFCGNEHLQLKHGPSMNASAKSDSRFDHWWVTCHTCGTDGPYVTTASLAIANWNIRADDAVKAQRDELLTACGEALNVANGTPNANQAVSRIAGVLTAAIANAERQS